MLRVDRLGMTVTVVVTAIGIEILIVTVLALEAVAEAVTCHVSG